MSKKNYAPPHFANILLMATENIMVETSPKKPSKPDEKGYDKTHPVYEDPAGYATPKDDDEDNYEPIPRY